jgi:hypothetical protein
MVHMIVCIVAARVMAHPPSAIVDMRGIGMARLVVEVTLVVPLLRIAMIRMTPTLILMRIPLVLVGVAAIGSRSV